VRRDEGRGPAVAAYFGVTNCLACDDGLLNPNPSSVHVARVHAPPSCWLRRRGSRGCASNWHDPRLVWAADACRKCNEARSRLADHHDVATTMDNWTAHMQREPTTWIVQVLTLLRFTLHVLQSHASPPRTQNLANLLQRSSSHCPAASIPSTAL